MKKIQVIIIDDEAGCIETLSILLTRYHEDIHILGTATDKESGLGLIAKYKADLDLLFLDIQMPGGDGFTLLHHLPEIGFSIIFTTAHDAYAIKAIKFSALDYLMKPIDNGELKTALNKFRSLPVGNGSMFIKNFQEKIGRRNFFDRLAVSTMNDIVLIELDRIVYLESDNNYTTLHLSNKQFIVSSRNLGYYEDLLSGSPFFRIHNSCIINFKKMSRYIRGGSGYVEMEDGTKLPVSGRRREAFLKNLSLI